MKIEKGNSYLCIRCNGSLFTTGTTYMSKRNNYLIDNDGDSVYIKEEQNMFQLVTNSEKPTHYQTKSGYDVIDFCNDNGLNFNRGANVKYVQRAGKKKYENLTIKESEIKDIKKAIDHLQRELKFLEDAIQNN